MNVSSRNYENLKIFFRNVSSFQLYFPENAINNIKFNSIEYCFLQYA